MSADSENTFNPFNYWNLALTNKNFRDMAPDIDQFVLFAQRGYLRKSYEKNHPDLPVDEIEKYVNQTYPLPYPMHLLDETDKEFIRKLEDDLGGKKREFFEKEDYLGWQIYLSNSLNKVIQEHTKKILANNKPEQTKKIPEFKKFDEKEEMMNSKKPTSTFKNLFERRDGYEELEGGSRKQRKQNKRRSSKQNKRKSSKRRA